MGRETLAQAGPAQEGERSAPCEGSSFLGCIFFSLTRSAFQFLAKANGKLPPGCPQRKAGVKDSSRTSPDGPVPVNSHLLPLLSEESLRPAPPLLSLFCGLLPSHALVNDVSTISQGGAGAREVKGVSLQRQQMKGVGEGCRGCWWGPLLRGVH